MSDDEGLDPNSSIAYIALSVLASRQQSLIPDMLYLFSPKQVIDFIKLYSGETIKVPTVEEFSKDIHLALAVYHLVVQQKPIDWYAITYQFDNLSVDHTLERLDTWLKNLGDAECRFLERLQVHEGARVNSIEAARVLIKDDKRDRSRKTIRNNNRDARRRADQRRAAATGTVGLDPEPETGAGGVHQDR